MGNAPSFGEPHGENLLHADDLTALANEVPSETGVSLFCGEARFAGGGGGGGSKSTSGGHGGNSGTSGTGKRYCLYTFFCGYRGFSWVVRVRFSDVQSLDDRIRDEARAAGVAAPTRSYTLVPQMHETRPEFLRQRHREVIGYLQAVARRRRLWRLPAVKEFFEVGARSFDRDLVSEQRVDIPRTGGV